MKLLLAKALAATAIVSALDLDCHVSINPGSFHMGFCHGIPLCDCDDPSTECTATLNPMNLEPDCPGIRDSVLTCDEVTCTFHYTEWNNGGVGFNCHMGYPAGNGVHDLHGCTLSGYDIPPAFVAKYASTGQDVYRCFVDGEGVVNKCGVNRASKRNKLEIVAQPTDLTFAVDLNHTTDDGYAWVGTADGLTGSLNGVSYFFTSQCSCD